MALPPVESGYGSLCTGVISQLDHDVHQGSDCVQPSGLMTGPGVAVRQTVHPDDVPAMGDASCAIAGVASKPPHATIATMSDLITAYLHT